MKQDKLSLFSYFGGKARFCKEIAELLDYDHTEIYIEPFGGAASVLLNKPIHETEIYSDVSHGLVALMTCLSDAEKASELIDSLYDTTYSEDCFLECLAYRNSVDDNFLKAKQTAELKKRKALFNKIIRRIKKANLSDKLKQLSGDELISFIKGLTNDKRIFTKNDIEAINAFEEDNIANILIEMESFDTNESTGIIEEPDELKLAVSCYVTYAMSRDGMGTAFSRSKFHSSEAYYKQIDRLYAVSERLRGVQVIGAVGALSYLLSSSYLNEERAMFYIDAPYLSADEDERNLGICYKGQMEVEDHRLLLKTITQSKARFLISNYDTLVYNELLEGWTKTTIETVTGVGSKKNNKRTECLWYNY